MGSWDRLSSSYTSAFIVWLFGIIPWFNSQPQIMQLINQKHLESFLLFHVPPLLLFQTQLLALFSLPPVIPRVVPCPPGSPISPGHSAGHRFGLGDVTVTCRAVCCRASQPCQPPLTFLWQAENHPLQLPALPVSFTLSLPCGRGAQKQYLNLEALWGIRKQCDFSASCITMRKGHSLPPMTFYVHKAMSPEL